MLIENEHIYPHCPTINRTIEVGGLTKPQLLHEFQQNFILMNEYGKKLFTSDKFRTTDSKYSLETVELTVEGLGFPEGASLSQIYKRARELCLDLCPLELGPYLRLQYLDQPEGHSGKPSRHHQAPYGSITIATEILNEDDNFPKGFYLRCIEGELWLRGYVADEQHGWSPDDRFVFCEK